MRQNLRQQPSTSQNLDSFLDILTNTVGVLMFIGLFISLVSVESSSTIRTPLVSSTKKDSYLFEVRNDKVINVAASQVTVGRDLDRLSLQACKEPQFPSGITEENATISQIEDYNVQVDKFNACLRTNREQLNGFHVETSDYNVSVNLKSLSLVYQPLQASFRADSVESKLDYSQLQKAFEQLNPKTDYIAFIVRSDSFDNFRRARKIALDMGFEVGWEPFAVDRKLSFQIFSNLGEGRAISPQ